MTLQDIFNQLTFGELSNLFIGNLDKGKIQEDKYPQLIAHVNLGLSALFKRFLIKEGELLIVVNPKQYLYPLKKEFAEQNLHSVEDTLFIKDTEENPFEDDIIKIERVYTDAGIELPLNDEHAPYAVFTPNLYTLKVPKEIVDAQMHSEYKTKHLRVIYRASHPLIVYKPNMNPEKVKVDLPYSFLEALLYFIASRLNNPVGMQNDFHAGNNYAMKFEKACQLLEFQNIRVDTGMATNTRLQRGGWV